jgi:outer membrane autotransporter protein
MDLQAQLISSQNKFKDVYNGSAKQTGLGLALSAELGKEVAMGATDLTLTPQAQFIYQNFNYGSFNDNVSYVSKQSAESLRLRAGLTLQSNKAKTIASKTNWNASLNLWQELLDGPTRNIGGTDVNANNTQKSWAELGVGVQHQLNEASQLNAQISVQKSISGNQRTGNAINVSYRLKW